MPPVEYLKAGAKLFNSGDPRAAQYLNAAHDYRDELTEDEQIVLDEYLKHLSPPAGDAQVVPASTAPAPPSAPAPVAVAGSRPAPATSPSPAPVAAPVGFDPTHAVPPTQGGTIDDKQRGRWLLKQAREHISLGQYEAAEEKIAEAHALDVRWGLFDDTPSKVANALEKARPQTPVNADASGPKDRQAARQKLKEARELLNATRYDQAEAIALEVESWGLSFGLFEDSPTKVAAAARSLRRRDQMRQAGPNRQPLEGAYEALVEQARGLMAASQLDQAEAKARQAQQMNVVPPLAADRAEAVLHDLAMLRARGGAEGAAQETPSEVAERDGNLLLAQGQREAAMAKFAEAAQLRAQESGLPIGPGAMAHTTPAPAGLDPNVRPVHAEFDFDEPVEEPLPFSPPEAPLADAPAHPGEELLDQAQALMTSGNYEAARDVVAQVQDGNYGLGTEAADLMAQIDLIEQGGALNLYEAALDAWRKGEVDRARALLTEVAASGAALDEGLQQRVQDLLLRLPSDATGRATLNALPRSGEDLQAVAAQKLNVEVGTKVAEARRLLETDPDQAIALLEDTMRAVQTAGVDDVVAKTMTRRLEVAIELAKKDRVAFHRKMQDKQERAEIEQKRLRILEADKAKKEQVQDLMEKAQAAYADGKLAEAETLAKRVQEIDPNELAAVALAWKARVERRYKLDLEIRSGKEESVARMFQEADAASIVPEALHQRAIAYPENFSDLTDRRHRYARLNEPQKDPKVLAIEAKLNDPVTLNIQDGQPLAEALDFLRQVTGLNIVLDHKALADEGLTTASPVSMTANNIKLKHALKYMLDPLGLTYQVDEEVLLITSPQANRAQLYTFTYYVGDLVMPSNQKAENPFDLLNSAPTGPSGSTDLASQAAAMGGTGMPGGGGADGLGVRKEERPQADMTPLIKLITTTIAPGTWRIGDGLGGQVDDGFGLGAGFGAGGLDDEFRPGTITPFFLNISLIIRHTAEVHEEVADLLRQLRRLQDLQISIEVRFITVNDSFFEQIGVDFDFAIQSDIVGPRNAFVQQVEPVEFFPPFSPDEDIPPSLLVNPVRDHALGRQPVVVGRIGEGDIGNFTNNLMIPFLQGSSGLIAPFNTIPGAGATFGISFLSDLEMYLFLTALQGDTRSNLVQAPKVTTFNGSAASIFNFVSRNFVAALIPIVGPGSVAFQPIPQQIPDGVTLFVTPVVTADRRYVRLSLSPFFITFDRFDTFPIPAAVGGGGLGGAATAIQGQLQLPVFNITNISTTVTVPDGGTVLLGGVKRLREERREFGVPVLSKTPWINRLFRNIGIGRTTDSLMIMVTPRIIILEEEEERLGIPTITF